MRNEASGNDRVLFQVGRYADPGERVVAPDVDEVSGVVENVRTGDAQVGMQVDGWEGDLHIDLP